MWKIILILLTLAPAAHAYKFTRDFQNGFYWQYLPLEISVQEEDKNEREKLEDLTIRAIRDWEGNTGLSIWDFRNDGATTNIIRWSKNFTKETNMDASSVLAVAIRYTDGPYFAKTEIVINNSHPLNQNLSYLFTTIKHELGHTMGLDHSDVRASIMWPELQEYGAGIDRDDVQGMTAAYDIILDRQLTKYVSPLAYEKTSEVSGLSCASVSVTGGSASALLSLLSGILISFVRKLKAKLKAF